MGIILGLICVKSTSIVIFFYPDSNFHLSLFFLPTEPFSICFLFLKLLLNLDEILLKLEVEMNLRFLPMSCNIWEVFNCCNSIKMGSFLD